MGVSKKNKSINMRKYLKHIFTVAVMKPIIVYDEYMQNYNIFFKS